MAVVAIAIFAAGAGTAWTINGWRNGAKIARLQSSESLLIQANSQCKTDVDNVKASVTALMSQYEDKIASAKAEAVKAQPKAAQHTQNAIIIKAAPIRPGETQCAAIEREQLEYLTSRTAQ